jgi:hypothetical protein
MNEFKTSNSEDRKKYRRLKSSWKFILKDQNELNYLNFNYRCSFKKIMPESEMVDKLRLHYNIYQDFLWGIKSKNLCEVMEVIFTQHHGIRLIKNLKQF